MADRTSCRCSRSGSRTRSTWSWAKGPKRLATWRWTPRCAIGTQSTTLPSLDITAEGRAEPLTDPAAVARITELLKANGWPLEVDGVEVTGPSAPSAGPPPYRIYRMVPTRVFGLPGTYGMDQVQPDQLAKPTRWDF